VELEFANENSMYKEKNKIALIEFLTIINIKHFDMLIEAHAKSLNMVLVTNHCCPV
jgi:tRNA(fMet)-specific endonuclease VapC